MAGNRGVLSFFICAVLLSSLFFTNEGRVIKEKHSNPIDSEIEKVLEELYVEAMKTGGPSHGGEGHGATHGWGLTLEGIKTSGPSPGQGH